MYLYLLCFALFVLWFCIVSVMYILICFVCTSVRLLPPSENSIAVSSNSSSGGGGGGGGGGGSTSSSSSIWLRV